MTSTGGRSTSTNTNSSSNANFNASVNATANAGGALDESLFTQLTSDMLITQERRDETLQALKGDVVGLLDKSLEADAWRFAAPRSQLHLLSGTGIPSSSWIQSTRQELMGTMRVELMETENSQP